MVEKIEAGKRYRVDMSELSSPETIRIIEDVKKYSDNGIILISKVFNNRFGEWEVVDNDKQKRRWRFNRNVLLPLREEAFLEIFKEEIYG